MTEPADKAVEPVADKEGEKPPSKVPAEIPQKTPTLQALRSKRIYDLFLLGNKVKEA